MSYETLLFLAFTFLILQADLLVLCQVVECENSGNYTSNSTYGANLNTMFSSLYMNVDNNGFYSASVGQGIDTANGIVLCVADASFTACRDCVQAGAADLLSSCPNQKQAIRWADTCRLRYSNETIYGKLETFPDRYLQNPNNAVSPELFMNFTKAMLDDLRNQAASGGPLRKVAAGDAIGPVLQHVYAMVQCSPDLSAQDCNTCLSDATEKVKEECYLKRGCQILWPSCNIVFETFPFYNQTRLREFDPAPPPAPVPVPAIIDQPSPPSPGKDDKDNKTRIIIVVVVSIVVCLTLAGSVIVLLRKKKKQKPIEDPLIEVVDQIGSAESVQYAFSTIKSATNDFSNDNKLGQGGFGTVYKGTLQNDQQIAVKRLSRDSEQGDMEFKNEVLLLAKLQHRNLVRLLGFVIEGRERLLVYEFVENASLDLFIFDPTNNLYLDWGRRYKIIVGISKGILYLHEDSRLRIIHRDLKASNILLDREMNPKIADFGMARLFGQDETRGRTSRVVGTYGYMPPEYLMRGQFSIKSDVFSFGVLVLEIISGRKNSIQNGEDVEVLLSYAWKNWCDQTIGNVVDPLLRSSSGLMSEMVRCIHIGLLCVQKNAEDRPTMASVVLMLSSNSMTLVVPSQPAFCFSSSSHLQEYNPRDVEYNHSSQNEASISELYPR